MTKLLAAFTIIVIGFGAFTAHADDAPDHVVLINTFTVPATKIDETIAMWESARDFLETQPGYISTQLHQSLSPDARYILVNVAKWANPEAYAAATALMRAQANLPKIDDVVPGPGLYTVIRE